MDVRLRAESHVMKRGFGLKAAFQNAAFDHPKAAFQNTAYDPKPHFKTRLRDIYSGCKNFHQNAIKPLENAPGTYESRQEHCIAMPGSQLFSARKLWVPPNLLKTCLKLTIFRNGKREWVNHAKDIRDFLIFFVENHFQPENCECTHVFLERKTCVHSRFPFLRKRECNYFWKVHK